MATISKINGALTSLVAKVNASLKASISKINEVTLAVVIRTLGGIRDAGVIIYNYNPTTMGYNLYGQLGDNTIISKRTPVAVCGSHTFCDISAGGNHVVATNINSLG